MTGNEDEKTLAKFIEPYELQIYIFLIGLALLVAIYTLPIPVIEELSSDKRAAMGILLFAAILWITESIPLYATSLIIVISQVVLISEDTLSADEILSPFFNTIIALFLGGFVLATALSKYNVDNKLARLILKSVGKSPKMIMFGLMFITAFLSMWMSNTATTALMIALAVPIYTQIPKEEKFSKAMILGIPFAANIGGMATPIGTPPNAIIIAALGEKGFSLTFLDWMIIALPLTVIMFLFAYFLLYYAFKPTINELDIDLGDKTTKGFSRKQMFVLIVFIITVVLWLGSSFELVESLFQSAGIIALIPAVVFFGSGLLGKKDLSELNWNVLLLMGGGMSLGNAIGATGLANWIVSLIEQYPMSMIMVVLVFSALAIILSTFMSNTATASLMAPIMLVIGMDLGSAISVMASIALACSMAMALPVSTPPNAIAYGTEMINIKDMIKYGALISIVGVILLTLLFGIFMVNLF
ncbi:MAG: SLC13 family permease [Candidatus Saliniplasma sp.]